MKKLLLTLASAALFAVPSMAQLNVTPLAPGNNLVTYRANKSFQYLPAENIWKNISNFGRQSRVAEEVRPHKLLSYATTLEEQSNLGLGPLPITYKDLIGQGFNGYGFAQMFFQDMLSRYAGNRISTIEFVASMGKHTNGTAFILDAQSGQVLWQAAIPTINTITADPQGNLQVAMNSVKCNYMITGEEAGLMIGWVADYVPADNVPDPLFKNNLIMPMYVDGTGVGMGANLIIRNAKGEMGIAGQFANWNSQDGKQLVQAAAINIFTEGENGLKDKDASVVQASTIRTEKATGIGSKSKVLLTNLGLDKISSIDYEFTIAGVTKTGNYKFPKPVPFYQSAQATLDAAYPDRAGRAQGTFTITKVNGVDDENIDNEDNETKYEALVFDKGHKRMPVVETFTSSYCAYCPLVAPAMDKIAKQTGGNFIPLNVHMDMGPQQHDPLLTNQTYQQLAQKMGIDGFPKSVINREMTGHPYYEAPAAVSEMSQSICEANMKVNVGSLPNPMVKNIQVTTNLDITFDAPAGAYALEYVVTEDGVTGVQQVNGYGATFAQLKKQNPNVPDATILQAMSAQFNLDFVNDPALKAIATGGAVLTPTYNDVACTITNSAEPTYKLPALKAGQAYTHTVSIPAPVRNSNPKVDRSKLSVTALLIDTQSGVVVTATRAKLGQQSVESAVESVETASDVQIEAANGAFQVVAEDAVAEVFSVDGKLVSSATVNGTASLPTFGKGVFVIRVVKGNKIVSKKAVF